MRLVSPPERFGECSVSDQPRLSTQRAITDRIKNTSDRPQLGFGSPLLCIGTTPRPFGPVADGLSRCGEPTLSRVTLDAHRSDADARDRTPAGGSTRAFDDTAPQRIALEHGNRRHTVDARATRVLRAPAFGSVELERDVVPGSAQRPRFRDIDRSAVLPAVSLTAERVRHADVPTPTRGDGVSAADQGSGPS